MAWVAVSEATTAHGKQQSITRITRTVTTVAMLSGGAAIAAPPAPNQLPTGGQVAAGVAAIGTNGNTMTVTQSSNRAAINWNTFDIGSQAAVNFVQPSANAVALNRVNSPNPSQIYGQLSSNGQVYLINAAGVYFAPGAQVNVGGIVATTMSMSDAAFMAGSTTFNRNGSTGKVINEGTIQTSLNGYIAMLAPEVRNSGLLLAQSGTVAMGAGESITLNFGPTSKLESITVTEAQLDTLVENRHAIKAPNGLVILSARAANQLAASVVNSGTIEAKGVSQQGGRIILEGTTVTNTGTLDVSSDTAQAGTIQINGKNVSISGNVVATSPTHGGTVKVLATETLNASNANINASGQQGGQIQLAANQLSLNNANLNADGGTQGGNININGAGPTNAADVLGPNHPLNNPLAPPTGPSTVALAGSTTISTRSRYGRAGQTTVTGDHISLTDTTSIDATGATAGGTILVGGDWQGSNGTYQAATVYMGQNVSIDASATDNGNGGKVVLWSDVTNAHSWTQVDGMIKVTGANGTGGQVETSGHQLGVASSARILIGVGGNWLLDPADVVITNSSGETNVSYQSKTYTPVSGVSAAEVGNLSIQSALLFGGTVTINTVNSGTAGSALGNITINADIVLVANNNPSTLIFNAANSISGSGNIQNNGNNSELNVVFNVGAGIGTYSGNFSGTGSLTKRGAGTLILSGTNTFSGTTTVEAANTTVANGLIYAGNGTGTNVVTILAGNQLLTAGQSVSANGYTLWMGGDGNFGLDKIGGSTVWNTGPLGVGAYAAIGGDGNLGVYSANGQTRLWGVNSGGNWGAALTVSNTGTLAMSNSGTLQLGSASALGNSQSLVVCGTLNLNGWNANIGTLTGTGIVGSWGASSTLTLGANNQSSTFDGGLTNIVGSGALTITKSGTGTVTLTGLNAYTGATTINAGTLVIQNDAPATKTSGFSGAGSLAIQSNNATFSTNGWTFGATLGGLTIGASTNTANMTIGSAITIAGPITVYGGNIAVNSNITTTASAGAILLKAVNAISTAANLTLQTNNSSLTFWSNSGGGSAGGILTGNNVTLNTANGSTSQASGGGDITMGGGYGSGSTPTGYATSSTSAGVAFGVNTSGTATINTGGGNISILGCSSSSFGAGGLNSLFLNAGQGAITISGNSSASYGVLLGNPNGMNIESAKASGVAINITGVTTSSTSNAISVAAGYTSEYIQATGGGNIIVTGSSSGTGYGIYSEGINYLASGGSITVDAGSTGIRFQRVGSNFGSKSGTNVTSSTANITLIADVITRDIAPTFNTSGNVTIKSSSNSFASAFSTTNMTFGSSLGSLTIGNAANTQDITVANAISIAGAINIYGGNIALNAGLTTTNTTLGDINLTGNVSGSSNMVLATGRALTVNQSGSSTYSGCISGTSAQLINAGSGALTLSGANTYTGSTNVTAGSLIISGSLSDSAVVNVSTNANYNLAASDTIGSFSGNGTINLGGFNLTTAGSTSTTFSGVLAGNGNLTKGGTGTLTLNGTNTYNGTTTVTGGTLAVASDASMGAAPSSATASSIVLNGGTLQATANFTLNANRGISLGTNNGTFSIDPSITLNYAGNIADTGSMTKSGNGSLVLTGTNTYSGATTISAGTLQIGNNGTTGSIASTSSIINNGTLAFNRSNAITLSSAVSGTGNLTQAGSGTLSLSGNSTYTGNTTIANGTLQLDSGGAINSSNGIINNGTLTYNNSLVNTAALVSGTGNISVGTASSTGTTLKLTSTLGVTGTLNVFSGNVLDLNGYSSPNAISVAGTGISSGGALINSNATTAGAQTGTITLTGDASLGGSGNLTLNGNIGGAYALTKVGAGTTTLSGTNTYSGNTTISGGTLSVSSDANLGTAPVSATASSIVLNGGMLQATANFTLNVNRGISLGTSNGTFSVDPSITLNYAGVIAGTGGMSKSGSGTLALTGANTYSGSTNVTAGTLQIGAGSTAGSINGSSAVNISSGATFLINRSDNVTLANAISGSGNLSTVGSNVTTLTGPTTYAGTTNVTNGSIVFTNNATPSTSGFIGNGTVVIQPNGSAFTSASTLSYSYANTLTSLTVGNATSTSNADLTVSSAINISGPISLYGGNVTLNAGLASTGAGSAVLTKAIGTISVAAAQTFQTNNGALTFWSNANGGTAGGVSFGNNVTLNTANGNASQTTGGGDITIGGGSNAGSVPTGYATSSTGVGVLLGSDLNNITTMKSGGGNVSIQGCSTVNTGVMAYGNLDVRSGQGAVTISGTGGGVSALAGVNFAQGTANGTTGLTIESSKTSGTAISISGISTSADGIVFSWYGAKYLMATGGGNIVVHGTGGSNKLGILSHNTNYLSSTGSITLNGGTQGIDFTVLSSTFGQLTGTNVTSSSANVTLTGDAITATAPVTFNTSGNVVLQSNASSFSAAFSTANLSFGTALSGLTLGRSTATQNITIASGYGANVAGPITVYGANISLNADLVTTNATNGNVSLSGNVSGAGNIALANGRTVTVNQSSSTTYSGCISGTSAQLTKAGSGTLSLNGTNTYNGSTNVMAGTLQIGAGSTAGSINGSSAVNISSGATFLINRSDNVTLANAISGSGNLSTVGSNVTTLTGPTTYAGTTNVTNGSIVFTNNATPSTSGFIGNGTVVIQPNGSAFTSASTLSYSYANTLTSLTVGNATSTSNADLTVSSAINISGPISLYGGNISVNANLITGTSSSAILLKGAGNLSQAASTTVQTNGSNIVYWANSNAVSNTTGSGAISLGSAASILSNGGNIILAGGQDTNSDGTPDGYARGVGVDGIATTGSFTISSGTGSVNLRGTSSNQSGVALLAATNGNITTSSGQITITGVSEEVTNSYTGIDVGMRTGGNGTITIESATGTVAITASGARYGLGFGLLANGNSDSTTQTVIKSGNTTSSAITLTGNGTATNSHGISFRGGSNKVYATAALGGITINGNALNWSSSVYSPLDILAVSGPINWYNSDSTSGIYFASTAITIGSKAGVSGLTTSTADFKFYLKQVSGTPTFAIGTTGNVTIQGVNGTDSFGQAFNSSFFGLNANSQTMSGFVFGSSANTANLTINNSLTANGSIEVYGGNVAVNAALTANNSGVIKLKANSGGITQTGAITTTGLALMGGNATLTNVNNNVTTLAAQGMGNLTYVNAGNLTIGTVNPTGITATGAINVSVLSGNIDLTEAITTTSNGTSAIVLNAGAGTAVGNVSGGNILISGNGNVSVGTGGRATLYTGSIADSTGVTALVGSGSGNFRYNSNATSTGYNTTAAALGNGTYAIYREQPTLTISTGNASIVYGNSTSSALSYSTVNGDTLAQALGSDPTVSVSGNTSTTGFYTAGNHTANISGPTSSILGYADPTYSNGTIQIAKANLTVSGTQVANTTYNNSTAASFSNNGTLNGVVTNGSTSDEVNLTTAGNFSSKNVGTNLTVTMSDSISGADAGNYNIVQPTGLTGNITAANLTITANSTSTQYGMGTNLSAVGYSTSGLASGETIGSVTLASSGSANTANVGSYNITAASASGGNFTASNYNISYVNGSLSVYAANITLTAGNLSRAYGSANPTTDTVTVTSGQFYNGDTVGNATVSTSATASTAAGQTANLTASAVSFTNGSASNYNITYVNGTLTITQANLTITANSTSTQYGLGTNLTAVGYTTSGLANSETIGSVALASNGSAATSNAGSYNITASGASGGNFTASNYNISYANGTLTVTPANITVTAANQSRAYGEANPTTGNVSVSGALYNGDTIASTANVSTTATVTTAAGQTANLSATANFTNGSSGNYNISYVNGTLTITQANLTITANSTSTQYGLGTNLTAVGYTTNGLANSETIGSVALNSSGSANTSNVGSYNITAASASGGNFTASNYNISYVNGSLNVTQAALGIVYNATYNGGTTFSNVTSGYTLTGLQNGETITGANLSIANANVAYSNNYVTGLTVVSGNASMSNYVLNTGYNGTAGTTRNTVTLSAAPLTITAQAANMTYSGTGYTGGNVSYSGFVGSDSSSSMTGSIAYSGSSQGATNVGNYTITASGQTNSNYNITYTSGALTINPAPLGISANGTYSGSTTVTPTSYSVTGLVNGETLGNITSLSVSDANVSGNGANYVTAIGATSGNASLSNYQITQAYNATPSTNTTNVFTMARANLTVTADNASSFIGQALPGSYNVSYSGFVGGQNGTTAGLTVGTVTNSATNVSGAGSYTLTTSGFSASNYSITMVNGTYTIVPADTLMVQVGSRSNSYGTAANITPTSVQYMVGNATVVNLTYVSNTGNTYTYNDGLGGNVTFTLSPTNGTLSTSNNLNAGSYQIGGSNLTQTGVNLNGTGVYSGSLTVNTVSLTPSTTNVSKVYDGTTSMNGLNISLATVVSGDQVNASGAGAFSQANVGTNLGYNVSGLSLGGADAGNYYLTGGTSFTGTNGVITAAPLTITANNSSKQYGLTATLGTTNFTSSGLVNGETLTGVTLSSSGAANTANVGSYNITASSATGANGFATANYNISYANGSLSVYAANITVTADNQSRTYGGSNPTSGNTTLTTGSLYNGDTLSTATLTSAANATSNVGNYTLTASSQTFSVGSASNYNVSYVAGNLSVTPANLTVTANSTSTQYGLGTNLTAVGYTTSGLVNSETIGSVALSSAGSANTSNVGSYNITAANATGGTFTASNYNISYVNGSLAVTQANLTITANNVSTQYGLGTSLGTTAFSTSGLANGETIGSVTLSSSGTANTTNVGSYNITAASASGGTFTASNYNISYANGTLTVTPANITVTANNQSRTYGGSNPTSGNTTLTTGSLYNGDTLSTATLSSTANATSNVGNYTLTASSQTFGSGVAGNYNITYAAGNLQVTQANLTITANSTSTQYGLGTTLGTTAFTSSGLQNGETIGAVTLSSNGSAATSNAGSYNITAASASGGTFTASNYNISYANGTLTVTPANITVTANNQSRTYGGSNPTSGNTTLTTGSLYNGDTLSTATLSSTANATSNVGNYTLTASSQTFGSGVAGNYNISYVAGTLAVNPAPLGVTATGVYNGSTTLSPNTYSVTGLVNGETITSVSAVTVSNANVAANTYVTSLTSGGGNATLSNYQITQAYNSSPNTTTTNAFTMAKANLTVTADNASSFIGQSLPGSYNVSINGYVGGQNGTTAGLTVGTVSNSATGSSGAGTYTLTPTGFSASNYNIAYTNGTYTIVPADTLMVQVGTQNAAYGTTASLTPASVQYMVGNATLVNLTYVSNTGNTYTYNDGLGGNVTFTLSPTNATYSTSNNLNANTYQIGGSNLNQSGVNLNGTGVYTGTLAVAQQALTANTSTVSKIYDGTTAMSGLNVGLSPVLSGDLVTAAGTGAFAQANAGTNTSYYVTGLTLGGADAGNYYLSGGSSFSGSNGVITPRTVTLSDNQVYSGSTILTNVAIGNLVGSQTLTYTGNASSKNVTDNGTNYIANLILGNGTNGGLASNYQLPTLNVTNAPVTITRLNSVTWTGGSTGNWFDPANWAGGAVPDVNNVANVVIPAGVTVTFNNAITPPAQAGTVQIDSLSGASGNLTQTAGNLSVGSGGITLNTLTQSGGNLSSQGAVALTTFNQTGGSITFNSTLTTSNYLQSGGTTSVSGNIGTTNMALTGGTTIAQSNLSVNGTLDQQAGNLSVTGTTNASNISLSGGTLSANDNLTASNLSQSNGSFASNSSVTVSNTYALSGGNSTIAGNLSTQTYNQSGGSATVLGTFNGTGYIQSNGTTTITGNLTARNVTLTGGNTTTLGSLTVNGSYNQTGGQVNVTGAANITTTGTMTLGNLTVGGTLHANSTSGSINQSPDSRMVITGRASFYAPGGTISLNPTNNFSGGDDIIDRNGDHNKPKPNTAPTNWVFQQNALQGGTLLYIPLPKVQVPASKKMHKALAFTGGVELIADQTPESDTDSGFMASPEAGFTDRYFGVAPLITLLPEHEGHKIVVQGDRLYIVNTNDQWTPGQPYLDEELLKRSRPGLQLSEPEDQSSNKPETISRLPN